MRGWEEVSFFLLITTGICGCLVEDMGAVTIATTDD
jgi:hypothetical protein